MSTLARPFFRAGAKATTAHSPSIHTEGGPFFKSSDPLRLPAREISLPSGGTRRKSVYGRGAWRKLARLQVKAWPFCRVCLSTSNLVADHIVPLERGGKLLDPQNTQTLCRPCNTSKGMRTMAEWEQTEGYARRLARR